MESKQNNLEVKVGDTFKAKRTIYGFTTHKCARIKGNPSTDPFYEGWLIDEEGIMINPMWVVEIIKTK